MKIITLMLLVGIACLFWAKRVGKKKEMPKGSPGGSAVRRPPEPPRIEPRYPWPRSEPTPSFRTRFPLESTSPTPDLTDHVSLEQQEVSRSVTSWFGSDSFSSSSSSDCSSSSSDSCGCGD